MNASTGWTYNYTWSNLDYATWSGCLLGQLFLTIPVITETLLNFKTTTIWAFVAVALILQYGDVIANYFMLDCLMFGSDPNACTSAMHGAYVLNSLVFIAGFILLFYRKLKVAPEIIFKDGLLDICVLLACIANVPCMYSDLDTCFNADIFQAVGTGICFAYFDLWFLIKVMQKKFERGSRLEVAQVCISTGTITVVYLAGSICYKSWGGNFYTNILWNMGYCFLPLLCIDSVVSPRFTQMFVKTHSKAASSVSEPVSMRMSTKDFSSTKAMRV
ncbi:hypothetical protein HDU82_006091 [Entophlyctis luteolus]|nr:hypothetical protein HDU82_006091 [Entophlyctis luteolus]